MNRLNKNKIFDSHVIIGKEGIKDNKIIECIKKIEMANLAEMGILETTIAEIITTKIMEINKEGIYMKCFYCQKEGHQINDCPLWKQHLENENKNF